jgi:pimeloyl-ACP methyl ester carboxylesterase
MKKEIDFKGAEVVYTDAGKGDLLFFLHGYLETKEIWEDFTPHFQNNYRIITLDIPGHGESKHWGAEETMDDIASLIHFIIDKENIDRIFLIGHSMGGYVVMAFADLYRERLLGYCLFHSTCFADSEEKKLNRDREISLIKCGKKHQIINVNIPKAFADENLESQELQVDKLKNIALSCSDDGTIALLMGMKGRPDRSHVMARGDLPLLLIGGKKDNYIPEGVFGKLILIAPHATVLLLNDSGHMGFIEEPHIASEALSSWAK